MVFSPDGTAWAGEEQLRQDPRFFFWKPICLNSSQEAGRHARALAKMEAFIYNLPVGESEEMLTELEKQVILGLQRDLELAPRPFLELAEQAGVSEEEFLAAVRSLQEKGYIRRFGATLRHQLSGFGANAMVIWEAPPVRLAEVGELFARHRFVTHCYARDPAPGWPYNLYTMLHAKAPEEIIALAEQMAAESGLSRYEILFSETELKKTTMRYFREE